jgi:IclR family acetate operon transcriptional repressor
LEEVATRQPVGVGDLARALGMPKSSAQRALSTLQTAGWIRPAGGEITRWVVTTRALYVGRHAAEELGLREVAMPVMEEMRRRTDETVHLMVPELNRVVLVERLETSKPVRIHLALGTGLPMHASANGKAVLAVSPPDTVARYLAEGLAGYTDTTITDPGRLLAELEEIRSRGYATNSGEWRSDIGAVAAAVLGVGEEPVASLSVSTPISRMSDEAHSEYGVLVRDAVARLSATLGHPEGA